MKDIRIFIASSKELIRERNYLAFLVLAMEDEFSFRGLRVRLAKWEYVDSGMTMERTEDRYLDEMYNCDAALVLFRDIVGMYTREELDKALAREGTSRLKMHQILFAADGKLGADAAKLRESLPPDSYGIWSGMDELRAAFLSLVDRVAQCDGLVDAPSDKSVRKITAFLAADEELAEERDAFADTVLNVNDLLAMAHRDIRVRLRFYDRTHAAEVVDSSEMGLVIYGTNYRMFEPKELESIRARAESQNPKRFYVFFRDLDDSDEKSLDEAFRSFRNGFVTKYGHFPCQFGDANALRLGFILSLERYAGESVEVYSTMAIPEPGAPFVGREDDLRRLRELLEPVPGVYPAGRMPVITGAGGTGKSELVRQYASQLRIEYPGGVFQVNMERVKTWDDTFLGVLAGKPNNGVSVKSCLGLGDSESRKPESEQPQEPITGEKVRDALLRRAREKGPILLVLDNVEAFGELLEDGKSFTKAFSSGFSERVRINVVATARTCDVMLRDADWAVNVPLADLSQDSALELLLKDRPADGEAELAAARRVAELLGFRALYLRRVPAILCGGNKGSRIVRRSYASLAESLAKDPLLTINRTATVDEKYLPVSLWKLVCANLEEWALGKACIKLVKIAAFFSPDGFPRHILRRLWDDLVFPGLEDWGRKDELFDQAFDLARNYNIFQSVDPVRIHRLDRAAIQETAKVEPGLEDAIGRSLATYEGMSPRDWLLLSDNLQILSHIPTSALDVRLEESWPGRRSVGIGGLKYLWLALLLQNPKYNFYLPWDRLNGEDWVILLKKRPEYGDICSWDKMHKHDWGNLLASRPQFAGKCPFDKLDGHDRAGQQQFVDKCPLEELNGRDLADLLASQPQFADECPWDKLDGGDWASLLASQPQFADECPWDKLDGGDWASLLAKQPQFAGNCRWIKMDGGDWADLLAEQSRFAEECPWELLNDSDYFNGSYWVKLLVRNQDPMYIDKCPWKLLQGADWSRLLYYQPCFYYKCEWGKLKSSDWISLLVGQPQFAPKCNWVDFCGGDWAKLLSEMPSFADRCVWDRLEGKDWVRLLNRQPQFEGKCPWDKLDGRDWVSLLSESPGFSDKCDWKSVCECESIPDKYQRPVVREGKRKAGEDSLLKHAGWMQLVCSQPQFVNAYPWPWDKLTDSEWVWLLVQGKKVSVFASGYGENENIEPLERMAEGMCKWNELDGNTWRCLLCEYPEFSCKCDWGKLTGKDWVGLLDRQPQFANECAWAKLDGYDWTRLLGRNPEFANDCKWEKLDVEAWIELLLSQPQFKGRCDKWEKFDVADWVELLCGHLGDGRPEFFDESPWGRFTGSDWAKLLCAWPKFSDKCPWEKLTGGDWRFLLDRQPQFAKKCDDFGGWDKLSGEDWAWLLTDQPQFVDICESRGMLGNLSGNDWVTILVFGHCQLDHKCLWEKLSGRDWASLLSRRPQFADRCPWDKFEPQDWAKLIASQPRFSDRCPWEQFDGEQWVFILLFAEDEKAFIDRCAWKKLDGWNWACLLSDRPKFADRCNWKLLGEYDWDKLLKNQPRFVGKCPWGTLMWLVCFKVLLIRPSSRTSWKMMFGWIRSKITGVPFVQAEDYRKGMRRRK